MISIQRLFVQTSTLVTQTGEPVVGYIDLPVGSVLLQYVEHPVETSKFFYLYASVDSDSTETMRVPILISKTGDDITDYVDEFTYLTSATRGAVTYHVFYAQPKYKENYIPIPHNFTENLPS